jgi:hypothetical protein
MKMVVPKAPWSAVRRGGTLPSARFLHRASRGASAAAGPAAFMPGIFQGGVKPPHSKALRAFSCLVVSRRIMKSSLSTTAHAAMSHLFAQRNASDGLLGVGGGAWGSWQISDKKSYA